MPFLKRAERGILATSEFPLIDKVKVHGYRIDDLSNAYQIYVNGANFEFHSEVNSVQFARLYSWKELRLPEPTRDQSQAMPQSRIEPLINEYVRLANYPAELVVRSVRQSDSSPYSYLVGARPMHRGLTYSSGSQAVFELDYRTGRLYSMSLYGVPRPPASITPGVSLESARIATLSNLLERYRIPGVEVKEFKLVIFGKLAPIENDDAVKASQRIWNVQGQLGYEGLFWSLDQVNGIPSKRYTALVDANTNEPYAMSEASRGGISSGKPSEMKVNLEGSVTVRLGKATHIATGAGVVFEQDKPFGDGVQVLLIGKERAYRAEYDRHGELLKIDGKIYKPSEGLSKALRGLM